MTKRQLIDEIVAINHTAQPGFLAKFEEPDLDEYLKHLRHAQTSRLSGDSARYQKYFRSHAPSAPANKTPRKLDAKPAEVAAPKALPAPVVPSELPPMRSSAPAPAAEAAVSPQIESSSFAIQETQLLF